MRFATNAFHALVETELRDGRGHDQLLPDPDCWWEALVQRKHSIECQLGVRRLDVVAAHDQARAQFRRWRARERLRFLAAVEHRLSVIRSVGF